MFAKVLKDYAQMAVEMPLGLFSHVEGYESIRALYFSHILSRLSSSYECAVVNGFVELRSLTSVRGRDLHLRLVPCVSSSLALPRHPLADIDCSLLEVDAFIQKRFQKFSTLADAVLLFKVGGLCSGSQAHLDRLHRRSGAIVVVCRLADSRAAPSLCPSVRMDPCHRT
jgi:hypothetical protein